MSNDVTLTANIKSNIPQEMGKAAVGFDKAGNAAKKLGDKAAKASTQLDKIASSSAKAAASAKSAARAGKINAGLAAAQAGLGLLPSDLPVSDANKTILERTIVGAVGGGAALGPWGALGGGLLGLGSGLYDKYTETPAEAKAAADAIAKATSALADAVLLLQSQREIRGEYERGSPEFEAITKAINENTNALNEAQERTGVSREAILQGVEDKKLAQKLDLILIQGEQTRQDRLKEGRDLEILKREREAEAARIASQAGLL